MSSPNSLGSGLGSAVLATGLCLFGLSSYATAAPISMSSAFILTQVSDDGTLGNGSVFPGLQHDPAGTGSFNENQDYLQPGTPFEGFGFRSAETGEIGNRNSDAAGSVGGDDDFIQDFLTDLSGGTFDNHVRWGGTSADGFVTIVHDFFFNNDDELINIETSITANVDLADASFARAIDPDPDNFPSGGTAETINFRGLDLNTDGDLDDPGEIAENSFVGSEGAINGAALALFSDDPLLHNTGIVTECCTVIDPDRYLSGGDFPSSTGDNGIGIAFFMGDLTAGQTVTINYAYVLGDTVVTVDLPDDPTDVPEPASLVIFGLGLAGLVAGRRRFLVR
ncbi:MAG: PEP-CTERM sorting domain-containing protein [Rhodospirillaceae bacterium]|nr:PEP-CTERM sorting domain-containing protein [Rhodospirillaceae bacterium]